MSQKYFTSSQRSVLSALRKKHLTSSQLLEKVDNVSMILELYSILDELRDKGAVKSYIEKDIKYHCAATA
jgi:hypothetical protein